MIPYERILSEMERQLASAKQSGDEQSIREALSAVRSLCEVALGGGIQPEVKAVPTQSVISPPSLESKPFVEKDANGGSIFDF